MDPVIIKGVIIGLIRFAALGPMLVVLAWLLIIVMIVIDSELRLFGGLFAANKKRRHR